MPKIVDSKARRKLVGEAVLHVVARSGVEGASLSAIAAEAGLAVGSVRHYFPNHDAILLFAMEELADRMSGRFHNRMEALDAGDVDLHVVESILGELLPLDAARHLEAEVWLAFLTASKALPALSRIAERVSTGVRVVVGQVLAGAATRDVIDLADPAVETERVAALLDGLALAVTRPPHIKPDLARQVLHQHLASLRRQP